MLGEKITATIKAKYYFGSPVTKAKVKYKVMRTSHTRAAGIPIGPWDWFYGPGYWWFAYDYDWYPGWQRLGLPAADAVLVAAVAISRRSWSPSSEVADRPGRHGEGRDRHRRGQGDPSRPGPQLRDHRRGDRPVAADDRRHGHGAGGPQAVQGLRLGRPRPLPRGRRDRTPLLRPDARRQAGRGQGRAELLKISYTRTASRSRRRSRSGTSTPTRKAWPSSRSRPRRPGSTASPTS